MTGTLALPSAVFPARSHAPGLLPCSFVFILVAPFSRLSGEASPDLFATRRGGKCQQVAGIRGHVNNAASTCNDPAPVHRQAWPWALQPERASRARKNFHPGRTPAPALGRHSPAPLRQQVPECQIPPAIRGGGKNHQNPAARLQQHLMNRFHGGRFPIPPGRAVRRDGSTSGVKSACATAGKAIRGQHRPGRTVEFVRKFPELRQPLPKKFKKCEPLVQVSCRQVGDIGHLGVQVVMVVAFPWRKPSLGGPNPLKRHGRSTEL